MRLILPDNSAEKFNSIKSLQNVMFHVPGRTILNMNIELVIVTTVN